MKRVPAADLPALPVERGGNCAWNANGTPCRFPGAMSHGQLGGGPWYCAWHFRCGDPIDGARIVEQSHDWDGKPESYLAMRRAYVYGKPKEQQREPGEDREEAA